MIRKTTRILILVFYLVTPCLICQTLCRIIELFHQNLIAILNSHLITSDNSCDIDNNLNCDCKYWGVLTLTWYTYVCLPFGALFRGFWYTLQKLRC